MKKMLDKLLTKKLLESRTIDIDKVDSFDGDTMGIEEIEPGRRYKIPNSNVQIIMKYMN
jgi:hypothetical protein